MREYLYEEISEHDFEQLVVQICKKLFGIGVQGFKKGPDGGRDARFHGVAELFPSKSKPWSGQTIIQAKHTEDINARYSDSSFSSDAKSSILSEEILRLQNLVRENEIDNYLLFSNRKLAGTFEPKIRNRISQETGIPTESIRIAATKDIDDWLRDFPDIPKLLKIHPFDAPFSVEPDELAEVIMVLAETFNKTVGQPPSDWVPIKEKNKLNNLSEDYWEIIRKRYLKYFDQVKDFLGNPLNESLLDMYEGAVDEFERQIVAHKRHNDGYELVLESLIKYLLNRDSILRKNKMVTKLVIYYMYWNCDLGKKNP